MLSGFYFFSVLSLDFSMVFACVVLLVLCVSVLSNVVSEGMMVVFLLLSLALAKCPFSHAEGGSCPMKHTAQAVRYVTSTRSDAYVKAALNLDWDAVYADIAALLLSNHPEIYPADDMLDNTTSVCGHMSISILCSHVFFFLRKKVRSVLHSPGVALCWVIPPVGRFGRVCRRSPKIRSRAFLARQHQFGQVQASASAHQGKVRSGPFVGRFDYSRRQGRHRTGRISVSRLLCRTPRSGRRKVLFQCLSPLI